MYYSVIPVGLDVQFHLSMIDIKAFISSQISQRVWLREVMQLSSVHCWKLRRV